MSLISLIKKAQMKNKDAMFLIFYKYKPLLKRHSRIYWLSKAERVELYYHLIVKLLEIIYKIDLDYKNKRKF